MTFNASRGAQKPRAVLYSRLSRETVSSTSLAGQGEDLFGLAEREGWDVVATFVDEGLSGGRKRANAEEALRMLREGEADVLAAYSVDRYSRMGIGEDAEVIRVIDHRERLAARGEAPRPLAYFAREGIRSDSGSDWRLRFALSSEMARNERDVMVSRRKRSIRQLQSQGRFTGRGPAPWGYRSAPHPSGAGRTLLVDPTEAEVIRDVARRLIAGESAFGLARELTARGVPTPRSEARLAILRGEPAEGLATGLWSSATLSQAVLSPSITGRIARRSDEKRAGGILARRGDLIVDGDGNPLQAFEPVLALDVYLALEERFSRGAGRGSQRVRRAARLGSGLVYCACGMKAYVVSAKGERYVAYRCSGPSRGSLTCKGIRLDAHVVEGAIEEHFLKSFGRLPAVEYVTSLGAPEVTEKVARLTESIRVLTGNMAKPGADVLALAQELAALQAERDALLELPTTTTTVARPLGGTWADVWRDADLAERRRYLTDAYDHVTIHPSSETRRVSFTLKPSPDDAPDYYL